MSFNNLNHLLYSDNLQNQHVKKQDSILYSIQRYAGIVTLQKASTPATDRQQQKGTQFMVGEEVNY